jgi:Tfp pilus assembly protein PilX
MQKLTSNICIGVGNNRGSALVTAVAMALIMAIAGIGFLMVTTHSLNNDSDAYTRDKAFYAAESGALLAAKSIMVKTYNNWASLGTTFFTGSINGLNVTVTININTTLRQATVTSLARTGNNTPIKQVTVVIQSDL